MKNQLLLIACISVAVGIVCGSLIVLLLYVGRRNKVVNSLVRFNQVVGLSGTVEIPFDAQSKGKVRVNIQGSMVEFVAFTDEQKEFTKGDRVFIVEMKGNKVWVVAEDSLQNHTIS
ncbi:MAG TPA: NfeD family protein [Coleofasciculaceae cyanobacterium]|jgi:membrane protein implicated in regulation of membrane protease activity